MKPLWLVFDLGGVLLDFNGVNELSCLTQLSPAAICGRLERSEALISFETGSSIGTDFGSAFASELGLSICANEMLSIWARLAAVPKPNSLDYVRSLRRTWNVACFSNTSKLHWELSCERYSLDGFFDQRFLSFELGLHKPDPRGFEEVTARLGTTRSEIIYFDDRVDIVDAAKRHGWDAHVAQSPEEISIVLSEMERRSNVAGSG